MKGFGLIFFENKQIGKLIFFVFGHLDQTMKNEKWNEPDNRRKKNIYRSKELESKYQSLEPTYHKGLSYLHLKPTNR